MTSSPSRLDALTGLRFVAAAAVFVYHVPSWLQVPGFAPGPLGQAAVGCFFVLSGFILAHVYRRDGAGLAAGRFYRARFARVWPLHAVCLLAMLALHPESWPRTGDQGMQLLAHGALLQGWTTDANWALAWNGPAWSLSVEAFFYAVFPLLAPRRTRTVVLVYVVCCVANAALYALAEQRAAASPEQTAAWAQLTASFPLPRLQEFVLGICAHALWQRCDDRLPRSVWTATACELAALAAAALCFRTWSHGQWGAAWIGAGTAPLTVSALAQGPGCSWAFAAIVVLGAHGKGWLSRGLAVPGMVYLGEISYAVYLVHTPVMSMVAPAMRDFAFLWHVPVLVGAATTLLAAAWLHALVEIPARQALLAPVAGLAARLRVAGAAAAAACRHRALLVVTAAGLAGLAVGALSRPTAADFAAGIVRQSAEALRGVRYGDGTELLGATLFANSGGLACWVGFAGGPPAGVHASLQARAATGAVVRTLAATADVAIAADGSRTTVFTARAPLVELVGAAVLALVVRSADGSVLPPLAGPIGADRTSLELLRLP